MTFTTCKNKDILLKEKEVVQTNCVVVIAALIYIVLAVVN